jgi:hypothetical protein
LVASEQCLNSERRLFFRYLVIEFSGSVQKADTALKVLKARI